MSNIVRTAIILKDSYNNVMVVQRGKKSTGEWSLVGKEMKGKEDPEKCITKAGYKDIDCAIFDLEPFGEYVINETTGEKLMVFTGVIRQYIVVHKSINQVKWISKAQLEELQFSPVEKQALIDFFNK